jgi:hypothetical protein
MNPKTAQFIEKAINIHGNVYDYSGVVYIRNSTKVKIKCPVHGTFEQRPNSHLQGAGCKTCGILRTVEKLSMSTEEFVTKCKVVHGTKYDYIHVEYVNINEFVSIICPTHGIFKQAARTHLVLKCGCPKCAHAVRLGLMSIRKTSVEDFIEQSNKIHNNKFNYELVDYQGAHKKIQIICPYHGTFTQTPNSHLCGYGCLACARLGVYDYRFFEKHPQYKSVPSILYLLKFTYPTEQFIKVGITSKDTTSRFKSSGTCNIETLHEYNTNLFTAFLLEQKFINLHKQLKIIPTALPQNVGGHSECFNVTYIDTLYSDFMKEINYDTK